MSEERSNAMSVCTFSTISLVIESALRPMNSANLPPKSHSISSLARFGSDALVVFMNIDAMMHKAIKASFCMTKCCDVSMVTILSTAPSIPMNALRLAGSALAPINDVAGEPSAGGVVIVVDVAEGDVLVSL